MTLKQAFTQWGAIPEHTVLAAKNRMNMQKVLFEKHASMDVTLIDRHFMDLVIKDSKADHRAVVNATSCLCHVLTWLHETEPNTYPSPDFDYNLSSITSTRQQTVESKNKFPSKKNQSVINQDDIDPLKGIDFSDGNDVLNTASDMKQNDSVKQPASKSSIPVAQLNPDTLKLIKIWPSRSEAERGLGVRNIDRAVKKGRPLAGFFWCNPDDIDIFQPKLIVKTITKKSKTTPEDKYLRRSVVQIDTTTLKEIARFESGRAAEKALGIKNVLRAIDRCGIAGGFRWAFADEFNENWHPVQRSRGYRRVVPQSVIDNYKAEKEIKQQAQKKKTDTTPSPSTLPENQREFLSQISDQLILDEIRRRANWHGTVSVEITTTIEVTL